MIVDVDVPGNLSMQQKFIQLRQNHGVSCPQTTQVPLFFEFVPSSVFIGIRWHITPIQWMFRNWASLCSSELIFEGDWFIKSTLSLRNLGVLPVDMLDWLFKMAFAGTATLLLNYIVTV